MDVDKRFGGNRRTSFSPQIQPLFCRSCAVPRALRLDAQVSFLRLDGFPGVEWGHVPFSDWDLEGGRDRQLLKVPGPMPSPQVSLPSD